MQVRFNFLNWIKTWFYTKDETDDLLDEKQDTLVSSTNIKTINNNSLLGSGNITIEGGSGGNGGSYINDFYGDSSTNELIIDYDTGVSQADIVTTWSSTLLDTNVPSEKLVKNNLDGKANTTHTHSEYASSSDIPTKTSELTNDSGFLTEHQSLSNYVTTTDSRLSDSRTPTAHTHTVSEVSNFPNLHTVATSGDYTDLSNTPSIPSKTSDLTNDSGFLTTHQSLDNYVTTDDSRLSDSRTPTAHTHTKSDITDFAHSHTKSDITNFSHSHTKSEITDFPTLSTVATSGSYNDLSNKPTIPTKTSDLNNDSGFITSHQDISGKEDKSNKVTSLSSSSTDTQYPSAKCVYDLIGTAITYINQ